MIKGMHHVGISVTDLARSIRFYRDVIGMEIIAEAELGERYEAIMNLKGLRCSGAMLRAGDLHIELFEFDNPRPKPAGPNRPVCDHGINHISIEVTDIDREYERLKAAGVVFHTPPSTFGSGNRATYGRDPDGNVLELFQPPVSRRRGLR